MELDCFGDGRILCGGEDKARWDGGQLTERLGRRRRRAGAAELAPLVEVSRFLPDVGCSWRVSGHRAVAQEARRREAAMVPYCRL